jgi:NADH-quinone oxidoreductase subunit K
MTTGTVLLGLSFWLFSLGVVGVLVRQSPLAVFMSIELMLNAANLLLVLGFGRPELAAAALHGLAGAFIIIAVAAAEVAVGLAIMVAVYRTEHEVDLDLASQLKG